MLLLMNLEDKLLYFTYRFLFEIAETRKKILVGVNSLELNGANFHSLVQAREKV